jgi:hypothetical protein
MDLEVWNNIMIKSEDASFWSGNMNLGEMKLNELANEWFDIVEDKLNSSFHPDIIKLINKRIGSVIVEEGADSWKFYAWRYKFSKKSKSE